jgi:hypothetical protein
MEFWSVVVVGEGVGLVRIGGVASKNRIPPAMEIGDGRYGFH